MGDAAGEGAGRAKGDSETDVRGGTEGLWEGQLRQSHRVSRSSTNHYPPSDAFRRRGERPSPFLLLHDRDRERDLYSHRFHA